MIDKKKIEEAASKYSQSRMYDNDRDIHSLFEGFNTGIDWFKENLWHDASEEPDFDKDCLVELDIPNPKTGVYEIKDYAVSQYDSILAPEDCPWYSEGVYTILTEEHGKITRWLYIEDLMKGGK